MKQATNPFAPVPLWRKRLPGYAAMGVATIALAVGLTTLQSARTTVAGTLLPVSEADAAAYGISAVCQLDDGSYRVPHKYPPESRHRREIYYNTIYSIFQEVCRKNSNFKET